MLIDQTNQSDPAMTMIFRMIDKILFGVLLLLALQIPTFSSQYHQFLAGSFSEINQDVQILLERAKRYGFADADAMINQYSQNADPIIREEMQDNRNKLDEHKELTQAMAIFENGNLFNKVFYIANPNRKDMFLSTLDNFKPGIPLSINDIVFAFVFGMALNFIINLPLYLIQRLFRKSKFESKASAKKQAIQNQIEHEQENKPKKVSDIEEKKTQAIK